MTLNKIGSLAEARAHLAGCRWMYQLADERLLRIARNRDGLTSPDDLIKAWRHCEHARTELSNAIAMVTAYLTEQKRLRKEHERRRKAITARSGFRVVE